MISFLLSTRDNMIPCPQCRGAITGLFSENILLWTQAPFVKAATPSLLTSLRQILYVFYDSNFNA